MVSPFLVHPLDEEENNYNNVKIMSLFRLKNKKSYKLDSLENIHDSRCIGSCHGWLSFLDKNSNPFLLNPLTTTKIQLPKKQFLPHIYLVKETTNGKIEIHYDFGYSVYHSSKYLQQILIAKLVLSENPSVTNKYTVIIKYKKQGKTELAFCRHGDEQWSGLKGSLKTYYDIMTSDNMLFALGPGPSVEIWDLNQSVPSIKMIIQDSCPTIFIKQFQNFPSELYSSNWYLGLSPSGEVFFVVRYIGEFVRYDGKVVTEADTLTDYASEPLICPYKTIWFDVYKLDFDKKTWTEVECLNDTALFLGVNQTMAVSIVENPEVKGNSIYFTDDYWDRMDEDYSYGGHDMGIFSLEDGTIEPLLDSNQQRFEPTPFWISLS